MLFLDDLVKAGSALWFDKSQRSALVLWRSIAEWADTIYAWARENGLEDSVVTVDEMQASCPLHATGCVGLSGGLSVLAEAAWHEWMRPATRSAAVPLWARHNHNHLPALSLTMRVANCRPACTLLGRNWRGCTERCWCGLCGTWSSRGERSCSRERRAMMRASSSLPTDAEDGCECCTGHLLQLQMRAVRSLVFSQ